MILRSGKVLIKKPKTSSANCDPVIKEDEDFISKLPDEVLTKILSCLTEAEATRTRVLSNRWNDIWSLLPNLRLVIPSYQSADAAWRFHLAVNRTLDLRGDMPIERFFLEYSDHCNYNHVDVWLRKVVKCNVQELELSYAADAFTSRFYWRLFRTCNTLVKLTLRGRLVLDIRRARVLFPCLKKLNLMSILYPDDKSLLKLLSGCPVLEELSVERKRASDKLEFLKVSSPSLKRLWIYSDMFASRAYSVIIYAPKLEHLYIKDRISTRYYLEKPLSLVEAYISNNSRSVYELLSRISSVEILTLAATSIYGLTIDPRLNMPEFSNLVKLRISIECIWPSSLLLLLLNNMPNLEHITFLARQYSWIMLDSTWEPPVEAPACLGSKVKEIIILGIKREEVSFIRYLLTHTNILETLRINAEKLGPKIPQNLLSFNRASSLCRIEFF